jgi:hypothetical protein
MCDASPGVDRGRDDGDVKYFHTPASAEGTACRTRGPRELLGRIM